jgi:DNA repair exonuclease SbcCD ATPase subunit
MRSLIIGAAAMFSIALTSCGGDSGKVKEMQAKLDSLEAINSGSTENINGYIAEMNTIYDRLDEIKRNEGIISDNSSENEADLSEDKRAKIQESINIIAQLMDENKAKVDALNKKLKSSGKQNKQLEELIANLQQQIDEKDKEINSLKEQLAGLNIQVQEMTQKNDSLNNVNNENQTTIKNQDQELNTVYYCMGTFKELTANKVIDKGGFFSAKSGSKLSADVNMDYFTKTDKRNISEIPLGAKKVTLKTSHPSGSYTLVKEGNKVTKLTINDQTKFWSNSKYCVLMLE